MFERLTVRRIVMLFFFAFIAMASAYTNPVSAQKCDSVTDEQIAANIYAKLKADSRIAPQLSHINVIVKFAAVKLQGWADNKKDYDKIIAYVSATACVRVINVNRFDAAPPPADSPNRPQPGGCAPGTKACGDICIPEEDPCGFGDKAAN